MLLESITRRRVIRDSMTKPQRQSSPTRPEYTKPSANPMGMAQ